MRRLLVICSLAALAAPATADAWSWPVDGQLLRPFAFGSNPYAGGQHRGIDVGAPVGAVVRAPVAGTVSFVGSVPNGGRAVTIRTADGLAVTLLQLGGVAVARGADVAEGERVGSVGESADAVTREPHVHLGVRRGDDEDGYLDPLAFLPARGAAPAPVPAPPAEPVAAPEPRPVPPPAQAAPISPPPPPATASTATPAPAATPIAAPQVPAPAPSRPEVESDAGEDASSAAEPDADFVVSAAPRRVSRPEARSRAAKPV